MAHVSPSLSNDEFGDERSTRSAGFAIPPVNLEILLVRARLTFRGPVKGVKARTLCFHRFAQDITYAKRKFFCASTRDPVGSSQGV